MSKLNPYAKAIVGGLVAGLGAYQTALMDGSVTAAEWAGVAIAALTAAAAVWATANKPADPVS